MNRTPETSPPSAAFSFKVKSLLLEMLVRIKKINRYLDELEQGNKDFTTGSAAGMLVALKAEAKEFYAISNINLLTLSWLAASFQLTDREALAVVDIKERVKALADRISKEPLQSWRGTKTAFMYIAWVESNLEEIEATMQREEEIAMEKDRQRNEEDNLKKQNRILLGIAASVLSALLGSALD